MENVRSFLSEGSTPTLEEVLHNREMRAIFINKLLSIYTGCTVISFKLNIVGPVKNNETIEKIFQSGMNDINTVIKNENWNSVYSKSLNLKTGPEYFNVLNTNSITVKEKMALIEENFNLGRLFDIDVLYKEKEQILSVTRNKIGLPNRKCFVCNNYAKICASRRAHNLEEMYESIETLIKNSKIQKNAVSNKNV